MWVRRTLFLLVLSLCVLPLPLTVGAQSLHHAWSDRFGDAQSQQGFGVTVDYSGNVIVAGHFDGTVDFGGGGLTSAGGWDIYVAKFDAAGNHLWSKRFGDASTQYAIDITADDSGDVIVTGYFQGAVDFGGGGLTSAGSDDIYVAKFDAAGNHLWSQRFGDASAQTAYDVATDGSGNVIVTGYHMGTVDFGGGGLISAGGWDVFVTKFNEGGSHLWSQQFGDASDQLARGVTVDGSGNVIVIGRFAGTVDFGGGLLTSAGDYDIFIAKFDASGSHLWSNGFGDTGHQLDGDITTDGSGNLIATGIFENSVDFGGGPLTSAGSWDIYLAKFDATGTHLWSKRFGDAASQQSRGITADGWGNVIVTGYFAGTVDFGGGPLASAGSYDIIIAKYDAAGNHLWSQHFGDASAQLTKSVAVDGSGNVTVTGDFSGTVNFGGGPLTSAGSEILIARFWNAAPQIAAIRDVPGDQGGWVNLAWDASGADTPVEHAITQYSLWRAIQPSLISSFLAGGASLVADPSAVAAGGVLKKPLIRLQSFGSATYYWYLVETVDAYSLPGYSAPVATLFDSTAINTDYHYFQVIAHTSDPATFFTSEPDSGYSVDNLAPAAPLNLAGEQSVSPAGLTLSWDPNSEADLAVYAVYRGTSEGFVPGPGNRIAAPKDTTSFDDEWSWDGGYYYKVSAVDIHGNESGYASLGPNGVIGAGGSPVTPATYLGPNYPNPFSRSTRIAFGLAEAAEVSLKVYDVSGRLVRVLAEGRRDARAFEVEWDGTNARGTRVASGVYFYHLTAGGAKHIRKAVLLR